ncbi:MAG: uroporphyrinogen-III synthase [Rhodococcus sp.]|nr:uroporphyrinogen-III synthase [Rhodococcus sp. (in: high G+C Gram-positive bacteria)]
MSNDELTGFRIAVTAERRADEFITLLERHGAIVNYTPAIHVLPLTDDSQLRAATAKLLESPPEVTVVSTASGFRGWLEAAREWGQEDALLRALGSGRIITRGPKAKGAVRGAGLREAWSPETESSEEVLDHLKSEGVTGTSIAVQRHGTITEWEPIVDLSKALTDLGADVTALSVYRWERPHDQQPMRGLVEEIVGGHVDAVTFTSAPAVSSLLSTARDMDAVDRVAAAFQDKVVAVCVGSVTASPFEALGVPTMQPDRPRLGSLAKHIFEELPKRR